MKASIRTIGLGGGCHWCTEAVFQSLQGVIRVEQGYIAAALPDDSFSEGVIVHYDPAIIPLDVLIEIHVHTHKSTSNHSMRDTYRSAVYVMEAENNTLETCSELAYAKAILLKLQSQFEKSFVTKALPFQDFKPSREEIIDYYLKDPSKPFCERYIHPKLSLLQQRYGKFIK